MSELFSLASLARGARDRPTPQPAANPAAGDDPGVVDLAPLRLAPREDASGVVTVGAAALPASPFVPPPLGMSDALGTPLPLVTPPVPGARRGSSPGWLFPVGGVAFAVVGLALALSGDGQPHAAPSRSAASSAAAPDPGAGRAAAPASTAPDLDETAPTPSSASAPATSPSASAVPYHRRPPTLRRPPPPRPTATATATVRPPPPRDPCAHCGNDLACNIACKAGG